jgi:hypothetical protein
MLDRFSATRQSQQGRILARGLRRLVARRIAASSMAAADGLDRLSSRRSRFRRLKAKSCPVTTFCHSWRRELGLDHPRINQTAIDMRGVYALFLPALDQPAFNRID